MRFRAAAAVAAAVLSLVVPATALAAEGSFEYRFGYPGGPSWESELTDPASAECLDIPEVLGNEDAWAFRPRNHTDATATVFKDGGCSGEHYSLRPGAKASDRLMIRSVVFS
ncbi:hypothetical protein [Actinosynnema sp. NPDC023587]|uniref:hypothetical protein n=1 Tax=Actinosynnema sp. NPDC023587 TaxID=3154695 RepID=UPI0033CA31DC